MDELMSGKWRVTAVNGQPVMADFTPEFEFNAEGQITGRASINRFFGPFTYKEN
ncbi:META domain-containing protein, partial [Timonella senegalensis]